MEKVLVVETESVRTPPQSLVSPGLSPLPSGGNPARHATGERPEPQSVRGRCPECGDDLVSNLYYIPGEGYLIRWECWSSLSEDARCHYRKVL